MPGVQDVGVTAAGMGEACPDTRPLKHDDIDDRQVVSGAQPSRGDRVRARVAEHGATAAEGRTDRQIRRPVLSTATIATTTAGALPPEQQRPRTRPGRAPDLPADAR